MTAVVKYGFLHYLLYQDLQLFYCLQYSTYTTYNTIQCNWWHLLLTIPILALLTVQYTTHTIYSTIRNSLLLTHKMWISIFLSETKSRETLRFSGNEIHCSPRDQSLSVNCYIARLSLNKMGTVIVWFLVTCSGSNSNVSRPGYNCAVAGKQNELFPSGPYIKCIVLSV